MPNVASQGSLSNKILIIACGALAHEIEALRRANGWSSIEVQCLSASLHNFPQKIPAAVKEKIVKNRKKYTDIFVAYADCGTGGELDKVLQAEKVDRLPGAHCYEFFATPKTFAALHEAEPGTYYLTDFLLRHFDRLVMRELGIRKHPELKEQYFGNYHKLIYLAQKEPSDALMDEAKKIAAALGLAFEYRFTGYGELEKGLNNFAKRNELPLRRMSVSKAEL